MREIISELKDVASGLNTRRKGSIKYWFARNIEKKKWRKIKNSNLELARQVSARITSYILAYEI